jgi:hypothetical protein
VNIFAAIVVLTLCADPAQTHSTFADRQWQSEIASRSEEGRSYQEKIRPLLPWSQVQCAMDAYGFSLVGDILPSGVVTNVDVEPRTKQSECYANAFRHIHHLPPPPVVFGSAGFPFAFTASAPIY